MRFGANHRPEMAERFHAVELGKAGFGDHLERFTGRIGEQMKVELAQEIRLWKSLLKSLAEAWVGFQENDSSPLFGDHPQHGQQWKSSAKRLWITGINGANPRASVRPFLSSLLARTG